MVVSLGMEGVHGVDGVVVRGEVRIALLLLLWLEVRIALMLLLWFEVRIALLLMRG